MIFGGEKSLQLKKRYELRDSIAWNGPVWIRRAKSVLPVSISIDWKSDPVHSDVK